jgi:hypothetical protein
MNENELKQLLREDNARLWARARMAQLAAWRRLQERLGGAAPGMDLSWRWVSWAGVLAVIVATVFYLAPLRESQLSLTRAEAHAPGLYAATFYSDTARADVVWISGMDASSDEAVVQ